MAGRDLNSVTLLGRLTKDPDLRYTPAGTPKAEFDIANNRSFFNKTKGEMQEDTSFFRIVVWGKSAENCNEYLKKGSQVAIHGRLRQHSYQGQDGQRKYRIDIQADTVQFLGSPGGGRSNAGGGSQFNQNSGQSNGASGRPLQNNPGGYQNNDYPPIEPDYNDTGQYSAESGTIDKNMDTYTGPSDDDIPF